MMIPLSPFGKLTFDKLQKFGACLALISCCYSMATTGTVAAPSPEALKQTRQQCGRLAEKLANARKLPTNSVQSASNYNFDKETCFAQIEISQILQATEKNKDETKTEGEEKSEGEGKSEGVSDNEKRHRQILLINATTNEILAIVMWEEPKGLRVGHIYDPKYDGPRDDYEKVDLYMRKKMALNMR